MGKAAYRTGGRVQDVEAELPFFARSYVGSTFTVLSGLSFLFLCMILPIVGKAGYVTMHARQNHIAFAGAVVLALVLAVLATVSKLERRKIDNSPLPLFSTVLAAISGMLLVALLLGVLHI